MKRNIADIERMKNLKTIGFAYSQIGEILGISKQRVHQLVASYHSGKGAVSRDLSRLIRERDSNMCVVCGKADNLHIHHIDGDRRNNKLSNMVTICATCHQANHFKGKVKRLPDDLNEFLDSLKRLYNLETDQQLADLVGVHFSTISNYRIGKRNLSGRVIEKLLNLDTHGKVNCIIGVIK